MIADTIYEWPTLWATLADGLVGVAGGIPAGFAVDRLRRRRERSASSIEEQARIEHVLRIVKESVDDNAGALCELQGSIGHRATPFALEQSVVMPGTPVVR